MLLSLADFLSTMAFCLKPNLSLNLAARNWKCSVQLGLCVACDNWNLTLYKYLRKIFQPIITASAKYVSNSNDLSIGAASQPVAFFMNPGIAGNLTDLVTASSVPTDGTAVTQAPRYLTY